MVEVVRGVEMSVGGGGASSREDAVVSSEGYNGVAGGGAGWRFCCRFSKIFGELREDLPYSLPFTFNVGDVFL